MIESSLLNNLQLDVAIVDQTTSLFDESIVSQKTLRDMQKSDDDDEIKNQMDADVMESLYHWFTTIPKVEEYYLPSVRKMIYKVPEMKKDYIHAKIQFRENEPEKQATLNNIKTEAYCELEPNPAYPDYGTYGRMSLVDFSVTGFDSRVFVWGWVDDLPTDQFQNAFQIASDSWDGQDCATAGPHLKFGSEGHGFQNWGTPWLDPHRTSHTGNLIPLLHDHTGYASYVNLPGAYKPTMVGSDSIIGKTLIVYEHGDDFGLGSTTKSKSWGSVGRETACCTIKAISDP